MLLQTGKSFTLSRVLPALLETHGVRQRESLSAYLSSRERSSSARTLRPGPPEEPLGFTFASLDCSSYPRGGWASREGAGAVRLQRVRVCLGEKISLANAVMMMMMMMGAVRG